MPGRKFQIQLATLASSQLAVLFQIIFIISVPQTRFTLQNRFCDSRGNEQAVKAVQPIENGVYFVKMKNMLNAGLNVSLKREEALAPHNVG